MLSGAALTVSCGTVPVPPDPPVDSSGKSTEETEPDLYDTIKHDVKYDNFEYHTLVTGLALRTPNDFLYTGAATVMDDAIYRRNMLMEDRYGVIITGESDFGTANKGLRVMQQSYTSGESIYDLCILSGYDASALALEGYLYDLSDLPNVDLSRPWYDASAVRDLSISKTTFYTNGSLSTVMNDFTHCVIFNKSLYERLVTDGTDVYQLVSSGNWTLDELIRIANGVKSDLNGDDVMDSSDLYGVMIWDNDLLAQFQSAGCQIASINNEGEIELTLYSERGADILERFIVMGNSDYCINFQHMTGPVTWMDMFTQDQVLFFFTMFNEVSRFRDMNTDYGFLPLPKADAEQPWYSAISPWHSSFICMNAICEDPERSGTILELLGYHSDLLLTPAYYEKTLIGSYIRDDQSVESLDIIFGNRFYDIGHLYRIASLQEVVTNLLRNNKPTGFASVYQSLQKKAEREIGELNKSLAALKEQQ